MDKNKILIGAVVLVLVGSLAVMFLGSSPKSGDNVVPQDNQADTVPTGENTNNEGTVGADDQRTFSLVDVAAHSSSASCYTIINGGVYDVTSFASKHPGGEAKILNLCGKDGSSWFNNQHGGQSVQEATLATLKIGIFVK